ncbi:MAG: MurR/RpiR family transcriptional regulator [Erysipelotrichaceae bacterium]|nr:MurR/RpiR family transcriptional regulator [Erysipelotrichaceae bacterium]
METVVNSLLHVLNGSYSQDTNYNIAAYMLSHPHSLLNDSLEKMAANCGVSISTLNRFCKNIGYLNYSTLREVARIDEESADITIPEDESFITDATLQERLIENLNEIKNMEKYPFKKASDMILQCKHTYIFGSGDSQYPCLYFQNKMLNKGKLLTICYDSPARISSIRFEPDDLIIVVSITGGYLSYFENYVRNAPCHKILIGNRANEIFDLQIPCGKYENHKLRKYSIMAVLERIADF